MKLDIVLSSTTTSSPYIDCVPIFINSWRKFYNKTIPIVIIIGDKIPDKLRLYTRNIVLYPNLIDIKDSFVSQVIRVLYPSMFSPDQTVLITDIDMIPMNSTYFIENISEIPMQSFVTFRNLLHSERQYAICYNLAKAKIWRQVNNISNLSQIPPRLKSINKAYNKSWYSDQLYLYEILNEWSTYDFTNHLILNDRDTKFCRLDRLFFAKRRTLFSPIFWFRLIFKLIKQEFTDFHLIRGGKIIMLFNHLLLNISYIFR